MNGGTPDGRRDLITLRRGTAAQWAAKNSILAQGEPGIETDTGKTKYGDGATPWNSLAYASGGSGGGSIGNPVAIPIGYSTVIPLDVNGAGKTMPETTLTVNSAFSVGPVTADGQCQLVLVGDGSHAPVLTAFTNANAYVYSITAGARNLYIFGYSYGSPLFAGVLLPSSDVTAPVLLSATVQDADATRINLVWSKQINATVSDSTAFAVSGTHGLSSHVYDSATTSHLVTGTPFIQTEAARTLSYVVPGTNKMQDLAATPNLVAAFSGFAVTNNVTNPRVGAVSVSNSTPSRIDITWTDTISSTIPDQTAFAVSAGHPLTGHVYVDSTHTYLSTSTAFTSGETSKTLSYTVPGTNPIKDLNVPANLGLGITGVNIVNNLVVSAPTFTAQSAPAGTVGTAYSYTFVATGATSYALFSGTVPAGLALSSGGVLSGTPTTATAYTFVVSATNTGGTTNSTSQGVTISAAAGTIMEDSFVTGAGAGTLAGRTPDVSNAGANTWIRVAGGGYNVASDNHVDVGSSGPTNLAYYPYSGRKNFTWKIVCNYVSGAVGAMVVRLVDQSNYYQITFDGTTMKMQKVTAGVVGSDIFSVACSFSTTTNVPIEAVMDASDNLQMRVNGANVTGATATGLTGSAYGFGVCPNTGTWYLAGNVKAA